MNVVVCVNWIVNPVNWIEVENGEIKQRSLRHIINPCDLVAVEETISLKESWGGTVTAICIGPEESEQGLRRCLAMGVDHCIWIWGENEIYEDQIILANILASIIEEMKPDLIFCGQRSADMEFEQIGAFLSEILEVNYVPSAIKLQVDPSGNKLEIQKKLPRGDREVVETGLPAVIAVEDGMNKPRYPNLHQIMEAENKVIELKSLQEMNIDVSESNTCLTMRIAAYKKHKERPKKLYTPENTMAPIDRLLAVMSGGVGQKKGELLEGKAGYVADRLAHYLVEKHIIE